MSSKTFQEFPKKQPKSYEIDLGQNNGPYNQELLIRYGDNTINKILNEKKSTNMNMNMAEIMKMNEILKPFQERQTSGMSNNFSEKTTKIEVCW